VTKPANISYIDTLDALDGVNGKASPNTMVKKITQLDDHAKNFIARSPFLLLATRGVTGCDASPRGDAPGFVKVLDETTLLLPERPGNRLADSMRNIIDDPETGLLFLIPGMNETLRVNGKAYVTNHAPYLEQLEAKGKGPKLAVLLDVTEIYFHCPKALVRSQLWNPEQHMERSELPTMGRMVLEQISRQPVAEETVSDLDAELETDIQENLY
jgi:PPOX class probable FMN-dependent enzyme